MLISVPKLSLRLLRWEVKSIERGMTLFELKVSYQGLGQSGAFGGRFINCHTHHFKLYLLLSQKVLQKLQLSSHDFFNKLS